MYISTSGLIKAVSTMTLIITSVLAAPSSPSSPGSSPQLSDRLPQKRQQQPPPPPPTTFPPQSQIQPALQSFQGQILHVIQDIAQNAPRQQTSTDYSSTGRALDFYLRNTFLPPGPSSCPQAQAGEPLPPQARNNNEAIAYLQRAQLALIDVSQDSINGDFKRGVVDFCRVVRLYGGAARNF